LYLLSPGDTPQHFSRTNGLSHDWIRALAEDHEGSIWIATGAGFDGLRARKVEMLSSADHWRGCAVLSFVAQADGSAWVGTEGAGLYHYANQQWSTFREPEGIPNPYVWSVLQTREQKLFVGTWGGGLLIQNGQHFEAPGQLAGLTEPVLSLYEDKTGQLWIGTTVGLYCYKQGKLNRVLDKEKLNLPDIRAITEDTRGALWFGMSGGGLGFLKDGRLKQFRKSDGLGSDFVVCLYADADGALWLGTSDNGITRFKNDRFANISTAQGLPSRIITHLIDDGAGHFWLGSQEGILRASKADLNHCADGAIREVAWLSYGCAEGMSSAICSGGFQPGACKAADGRLWFPTTKGLALVDPGSVSTNTAAPPIVIEEMLVDENPIALNGTLTGNSPLPSAASAMARTKTTRQSTQPVPLRIAPGRQRFEFHYTGLSFLAPEKVRFKYQLEGLEHEWTDAGSRRVADYSYLPPGAYRFQVIGCNNDGLWNKAGATLAFNVMPFFWQTWWFQVGSLSSGAGALGAGVFWASRRRVKLKLEQLEHQRTLERERARIARDIHDDLGACLTRITLLSQSIRSEVDSQTEMAAEADQIYATARELTRAMDEIVWAVNPKHDTLDSLVSYLGRFAQQFLAAASIRCRLDVPLSLPPSALTSEIRHNTFLAFKEALNNIVKHAAATEVRISLELQPTGFVLLIIDNGRGFTLSGPPIKASDTTRLNTGNGLFNMRRRMEEIGGCCEWTTAPGEGARVKLVVSGLERGGGRHQN
jgi:signal transduction histidine kinase/streptogramin lyase